MTFESVVAKILRDYLVGDKPTQESKDIFDEETDLVFEPDKNTFIILAENEKRYLVSVQELPDLPYKDWLQLKG